MPGQRGQRVDPSGTGDAWEKMVLDEAVAQGWLVHFLPDWMRRIVSVHLNRYPRSRIGKTWPSAGAPDFIMVHPGRGLAIAVELKVGGAKSLRKEQRIWRDALLAAGVSWYVWAPEDFATIVRPVLRGDREAGRVIDRVWNIIAHGPDAPSTILCAFRQEKAALSWKSAAEAGQISGLDEYDAYQIISVAVDSTTIID